MNERYTPKGFQRWAYGRPVVFIDNLELPFLLNESERAMNGGRCVEIGCLWGGFTSYGAKISKNAGGQYVAVDPWHSESSSDLPTEWDWEDMFVGFQQNLNDVGLLDFVEIKRMKSSEAAQGEADESLEFVFVDGDHTYEGCLEDIKLWFPKLKKGGVMLGHDYGPPSHAGVKKAVDEFFGKPDELSEGWFRVWKVTK